MAWRKRGKERLTNAAIWVVAVVLAVPCALFIVLVAAHISELAGGL